MWWRSCLVTSIVGRLVMWSVSGFPYLDDKNINLVVVLSELPDRRSNLKLAMLESLPNQVNRDRSPKLMETDSKLLESIAAIRTICTAIVNYD
jgi:hypothetical protein